MDAGKVMAMSHQRWVIHICATYKSLASLDE
jgi:hypothetical protein